MNNIVPVPEMHLNTGIFLTTPRDRSLPNSFESGCSQVVPSYPTIILLMHYFFLDTSVKCWVLCSVAALRV